MIRAFIVCLLAALPASAQDLRGLRPGMPISALDHIGVTPNESDRRGLQRFSLSFPDGQVVDVFADDTQTIVRLITYEIFSDADTPPASTGFVFNETEFGDVAARLGLLDTPSEITARIYHEQDDNFFHLIHHIPDAPEVLVVLHFDAIRPITEAATGPTAPFPATADLVFVELIDRALAKTLFDLVPSSGTAVPFPIPIAEAFPPRTP